jgi:hypothetical protein
MSLITSGPFLSSHKVSEIASRSRGSPAPEVQSYQYSFAGSTTLAFASGAGLCLGQLQLRGERRFEGPRRETENQDARLAEETVEQVDDVAGRALFDEDATPCAPGVLSATRTIARNAREVCRTVGRLLPICRLASVDVLPNGRTNSIDCQSGCSDKGWSKDSPAPSSESKPTIINDCVSAPDLEGTPSRLC